MKTELVVDDDNISTMASVKSSEESSENQEEVLFLEHSVRPPITTRIKGMSLIILTSIAATTQGACVKYVKDLPTGMIIIFIAANSLCLFSVWVMYRAVSLTNFPIKK